MLESSLLVKLCSHLTELKYSGVINFTDVSRWQTVLGNLQPKCISPGLNDVGVFIPDATLKPLTGVENCVDRFVTEQ